MREKVNPTVGNIALRFLNKPLHLATITISGTVLIAGIGLTNALLFTAGIASAALAGGIYLSDLMFNHRSVIDKIKKENAFIEREEQLERLRNLEGRLKYKKTLSQEKKAFEDLKNLQKDFRSEVDSGAFNDSEALGLKVKIETIFKEAFSHIETVADLFDTMENIGTERVRDGMKAKIEELRKEVEQSLEILGEIIIDVKVQGGLSVATGSKLKELVRDLEDHMEINQRVRDQMASFGSTRYSDEDLKEFERLAEESASIREKQTT